MVGTVDLLRLNVHRVRGDRRFMLSRPGFALARAVALGPFTVHVGT